jgi:hypothetical protein
MYKRDGAWRRLFFATLSGLKLDYAFEFWGYASFTDHFAAKSFFLIST